MCGVCAGRSYVRFRVYAGFKVYVGFRYGLGRVYVGKVEGWFRLEA